MPAITVVFGVLLIVLGVAAYFGTDRASLTALIPAGFGLLLLLAGALAFKDRMLKHAMHSAAVLALLGLAGSARGLSGLVKVLRGEAVDRPAAVYAQSIMAVLCLVFVVLCVRSFINARRKTSLG